MTEVTLPACPWPSSTPHRRRDSEVRGLGLEGDERGADPSGPRRGDACVHTALLRRRHTTPAQLFADLFDKARAGVGATEMKGLVLPCGPHLAGDGDTANSRSAVLGVPGRGPTPAGPATGASAPLLRPGGDRGPGRAGPSTRCARARRHPEPSGRADSAGTCRLWSRVGGLSPHCAPPVPSSSLSSGFRIRRCSGSDRNAGYF